MTQKRLARADARRLLRARPTVKLSQLLSIKIREFGFVGVLHDLAAAEREFRFANDAERFLRRTDGVDDTLLNRLQALRLHSLCARRDNFGGELTAQHRTLHGTQELLRRVVARQGEVLDRGFLRRAELVAARDSGVHGARRLHDSVLEQLGADAIGGFRANLQREQAFELQHGGVDDFLVALRDPVRLAARNRRARRENEFKHGLLFVIVLLARRAHVGVDGEQRRAREAQVIDVFQLAIKPKVNVNHRDTLELLELRKVRHFSPRLGHHALDDVHGHGGNVLVGFDDVAVGHGQVLHRTVFVEHELLESLLRLDGATILLDRVHHGCAQSIGLVTVQECHLQSVRFVQESVHRRQHDGHRKLIRVNEIQSLGHGNEHLLIDALGHTILAHEVLHAEFVLLVDEVLPFNQHGQQRRRRLQLFRQTQHFLIHENRQTKVERRRDPLNEIERRELSRKLLHGEDHLVHLPL
mmetsp:Transcript_5017/g.19290  ORF Transcript_5017/g.19290 Transcript_5017/m.19290 type:complete len:470 (+) Transcript_5017:1112-2521(+)